MYVCMYVCMYVYKKGLNLLSLQRLDLLTKFSIFFFHLTRLLFFVLFYCHFIFPLVFSFFPAHKILLCPVIVIFTFYASVFVYNAYIEKITIKMITIRKVKSVIVALMIIIKI